MDELLDFAMGQTNHGETSQLSRDAGGVENDKGQNHTGRDLILRQSQSREQLINLSPRNEPLLYDCEAALVESRRINPNLKTQAEMVDI